MTKTYYQAQQDALKLIPASENYTKLQITSINGKTNWMNITEGAITSDNSNIGRQAMKAKIWRIGVMYRAVLPDGTVIKSSTNKQSVVDFVRVWNKG